MRSCTILEKVQVRMMVWFEIKKVLGRPSGKIALFLFLCVVILSCWTTVAGDEFGPIIWVNEQGDAENGFSAYRQLRQAQKEWKGELDEAHLADIIRELNRIAATPEYQSDEYNQNDIAFHWRMGIEPVREMLYRTFSPGLQNFNYYLADTLSPSVAGEFYSRRVELLRSYLYEEGNEEAATLSDREKAYLIRQYEKLEGPIYYDYKEGWFRTLDSLAFIMLLGTLILGYLVSGIFSNEFKWKADAVYFTTYYGRNKAVSAKIKAGLVLVSVLYWGGVLVCTLFTLCFCGFDGGNCAIQFDYYRSFYNLTYLQTYLLYVVSSYIGTLFMMFLCMWVSAKTRSSVFAVTIPFILIFVPNFFENSKLAYALTHVLALLPDKLFNLSEHLKYFEVYDLGFTVVGAWPLLFVIYTILALVLIPAMYREFRTKQIG